jgi:hypothetical protein
MLKEKFSAQGRAQEENTSTPKFTDPRPDLEEDSKLWPGFLSQCYQASKDLYYAVHGFRCKGTKLIAGKGSYLLRPIFSDNGWCDQKEYDSLRAEYLLPYAKELGAVLRGLAND